MKPFRIHVPAAAEQADSTMPLINVIFLLLIFVMLAGVIRSADPVPLDPALTRGGEETEATDPADMIYMAADGSLTWREFTSDEAILAAIAKTRKPGEETTAVLKADRAAPADRVAAFARLAQAAGLSQLLLVMERTP